MMKDYVVDNYALCFGSKAEMTEVLDDWFKHPELRTGRWKLYYKDGEVVGYTSKTKAKKYKKTGLTGMIWNEGGGGYQCWGFKLDELVREISGDKSCSC